jgi:hypothetical protein
MRVLFVGNSYVYFNDLPGLVASLAASGGIALETHSVVEGGMTLLGHSKSAETLDQIRSGGWDGVVLQEQSTRPIYAPTAMAIAARQLAREIRRAGSRTLLYLTWARKTYPDQQADLDGAYYRVSQDLGAEVAPVGPAWRLALAERPGLALHQADGSHPAASGTYLAACVFFAVLTGRSPVGLDVRTVQAGDGGASTPVELSIEDAEFFQRVAWQAVRSGPRQDSPAGDEATEPSDTLQADLDVALAQETSPLRGLSANDARTLLPFLERRHVPTGTTLFSAGEVGAAAYLVLEGTVELASSSGEAARYDLTRLGMAACLGEESLRGATYGTTVSTASDATVLVVRESDLADLAAREPTIAEVVRRNLLPDQPA